MQSKSSVVSQTSLVVRREVCCFGTRSGSRRVESKSSGLHKSMFPFNQAVEIRRQRTIVVACVQAAIAWSRIRPGLSVGDVQRDFNPATRIPLRSKSRDFGQVGQQVFRAFRIRRDFFGHFLCRKESDSRTDSATRSTVSSGRTESLI